MLRRWERRGLDAEQSDGPSVCRTERMRKGGRSQGLRGWEAQAAVLGRVLPGRGSHSAEDVRAGRAWKPSHSPHLLLSSRPASVPSIRVPRCPTHRARELLRRQQGHGREPSPLPAMGSNVRSSSASTAHLSLAPSPAPPCLPEDAQTHGLGAPPGSVRTPLAESGGEQPGKSTRQSTHVEEIGLVPLAEEPLCRHVLQLLPRDTAA